MSDEKKDVKKDDQGGGAAKGPPSFGMLLSLGAGVMLILILVGVGLENFGHSVANFSIGFRIGKADFIQLLLYVLGAAGLAMWIFGQKKH